MQIVIFPDPVLKQSCEPCGEHDKSLKRIAKQMAHTMYKNNGCGLAGPQVGILQRIVVLDCDTESNEPHPVTLINPVVVETSGDDCKENEGCLSFPGISVPVTRKAHAVVTYTDLSGHKCTIEGEGLLGRCLQHEIDHVDGITMIDRCDPIDRLQAIRDYDAALAAGARPGDVSIRAKGER
jgi:peptide deformylase